MLSSIELPDKFKFNDSKFVFELHASRTSFANTDVSSMFFSLVKLNSFNSTPTLAISQRAVLQRLSDEESKRKSNSFGLYFLIASVSSYKKTNSVS